MPFHMHREEHSHANENRRALAWKPIQKKGSFPDLKCLVSMLIFRLCHAQENVTPPSQYILIMVFPTVNRALSVRMYLIYGITVTSNLQMMFDKDDRKR